MSKPGDLFLRHRRVTEQFVGLMPAEHFSFKPYEGAMSFGQLAVHLMTSGDMYCAALTGTAMQPADEKSLPQDAAAIKRFVTERTAAQLEVLESLGDDPARTITLRGNSITVGDVTARWREHEAHHKGQMMMMLRMCGVRDQLFYTLK